MLRVKTTASYLLFVAGAIGGWQHFPEFRKHENFLPKFRRYQGSMAQTVV
jgi:hypothetical protein